MFDISMGNFGLNFKTNLTDDPHFRQGYFDFQVMEERSVKTYS